MEDAKIVHVLYINVWGNRAQVKGIYSTLDKAEDAKLLYLKTHTGHYTKITDVELDKTIG